MKALLINTTLSVHRNLFAMRTVLPIVVILTLVILALLLPGTVFAGPGTSSGRCGGGC